MFHRLNSTVRLPPLTINLVFIEEKRAAEEQERLTKESNKKGKIRMILYLFDFLAAETPETKPDEKTS
jgi:hypothetical protein